MVWNKSYRVKLIAFLLSVVCLLSCTVSYKFNGASIDYTKVSTITIADFPNQAPYVHPPLAQIFTEKLKDTYIRQTRLRMTTTNGDLQLEGEIVGYDLAPMAIKEDALSSLTKLTITIRVRYFNQTNQHEDFERSFSAFREFNSNTPLQQVQDVLNAEIVDELTDQIYNATVANW